MDLISDILRDLRLQSAVLSTAEFRAPWGFDKGAVGAAPFHIIVQGHCVLELAGGTPVDLAAGDLVVLPHGSPHALMSEHGVERTPFKDVLAANGIDANWTRAKRLYELGRISFGGTGALTRTITGVFTFEDRRRNSLLEALPHVIHVRGRMGRGPAWLEGSLALLIEELTAGKPGFQTIAERVADIVFVQAIRDCIANTPADASGWLRGLTDPQIARALALVHERPGEPWTVASLGTAVALSRTVFANRFRSLVGTSVMDYVTARRMHAAAGMLTGSTEALAKIANGAGYESEISFSKAFRRWAGVPPGRYRRMNES
ncbi:MAG: AraC family transcriptional regulator [Rhizobiales bacterium]|nr:AraC family transcriptional regulator [Hyphomicrobiales bacterium]